MNEKQMKQLRVSDIVRWDDGTRGQVARLLTHGVVIDWEDGQIDCALSFEDGEHVNRRARDEGPLYFPSTR